MQNEKKYHGYLLFPRHAKLLYQELGTDLFGFYLSLVMEAGWYRRSRYFGIVAKTQTELAKELNMTQATVSRNLSKLEEHKYFILRRTKQKYIVLGYFPLFLKDVVDQIHSNDYANLHSLYADLQRINADLQAYYAKMQEKRAQKDTQSINVSYIDSVLLPDSTEDVDNDELDNVEDIDNEID